MRLLPNWIEAYQDFMVNTEPAKMFDKWSAYYVVAAALRKKVHLSLGRINVYPNIYAVLVAEPGRARKSQAISYGLEFIANIPELVVSADAITKEAMLEDLENCAVDELMPDGKNFRHSSLNIVSKEFESFLGQKKENTKMLVLLTDLFDCQELPWKYRTKNSGTNVIPSVFINLYAGTTPDSLASSLPSSAIGGGLTSRILFIWAEQRKKKVPKPEMTEDEKKLKEQLIKDLYVISRLCGTYEMDQHCENKWTDWYMAYEELDENRICKDPSFNGWYSRKPLYIHKVAILRAAAKSNNLIIQWEDIEEAISEIEEVESQMGNVFKAIGKSTVTGEVDLILQLVERIQYISEKDLMSLVWRDMDSDKFDNVVQTAIRTGRIKRVFVGPKNESGGVWYRVPGTVSKNDNTRTK